MRIDLGYYGLLKEESSHYQELPALYYYGKIITFADLLAQIHGLAGGLLAKGIKKGDIITIFLPNIPQSVIAFYAVNQLGAIA
ncbi:MAG: AMP-binding protein, partial [Clostridiales bacterium]